jgi:hypothetical protein
MIVGFIERRLGVTLTILPKERARGAEGTDVEIGACRHGLQEDLHR